MPTTDPTYGWIVPEDADALADGAAAMRTLAAGVAATIETVRIAAGAVTNGTNGQALVTFPTGRFTAPPRVALGVHNYPGNQIVYSVDQITETGFRVNAYNTTNGQGAGVAVNADWIAVQTI